MQMHFSSRWAILLHGSFMNRSPWKGRLYHCVRVPSALAGAPLQRLGRLTIGRVYICPSVFSHTGELFRAPIPRYLVAAGGLVVVVPIPHQSESLVASVLRFGDLCQIWHPQPMNRKDGNS
ncbi:hypothetical protein NEOLEDRAFT_848869 [Neolentinus lepideus HHB14362 ss-1]|uniref:Uncharacterized protein n=1 Tax=Neolentinus lepideus HHB14362 ss-1 TaxID=1314782 RepID=A0A165UP48_9AGAM|nr:hypothetical protein NEOLEDRAFT_848869 [Neolentinus lepideus HHB14362 ss-1]